MDYAFLRTAAVLLIVMVLMGRLFGVALPLDFTGPAVLLGDTTLLAGYIYLGRTLVRLPFALVIAFRMLGKYRRDYGPERDMLLYGFMRGLLDPTRWRGANPLAVWDRFGLLLIAYLVMLPGVGRVLVILGGMLGLLLVLVVYLVSGTFGFLLGDALHSESPLQAVRARTFNLFRE